MMCIPYLIDKCNPYTVHIRVFMYILGSVFLCQMSIFLSRCITMPTLLTSINTIREIHYGYSVTGLLV